MIDVAALYPHYFAHLSAIWRAIPAELRGTVYAAPSVTGVPNTQPLSGAGKDRGNLTLVAGHPDLVRLRYPNGVLIEHGCGQSYSNRHPAHPGGDRRDKARLFLHPNQQAADRDKARYPAARVEIIGSPRLVELQMIPRQPKGDRPTVAILARWPSTVARESGSAWGHWRNAYQSLADSGDYHVLGHAHPRSWSAMHRQYQRMGIEPVPRFEDIIARADCVIFENSSSGYEAAGCGIPVVVLDSPQMRQNIQHGLRFFSEADIGPRIILPDALPAAINAALNTVPWPGAEERLDRVFPPVESPAETAAAIIVEEHDRLTRELLQR